MKKKRVIAVQLIARNVPETQYPCETAEIMPGVIRVGIQVLVPHSKAAEAHQQLLYRLVNVSTERVTSHPAFKIAKALAISRV
jgi:hypothetical protein